MKKIRINFVDRGGSFNPNKSIIYKLLNNKYSVEISQDPEYLFIGSVGNEHLKYDCLKIATCGENIHPDFNFFDYAIGFDYMDFGDRYHRIPLFVFYQAYDECQDEKTKISNEKLLNRKFCSFVVSNDGGNPLRQAFFEALSKYKKVDSGGRWLNNIGLPPGKGVPNKLEFCSQYKFNIAFENSDTLGYTTEKLVEPLSIHSIPIYWGNPLVSRDFSPNCFLQLKDYNDISRIVTEVAKLDQDDEAYLQMCNASRFACENAKKYRIELADFLYYIIEQPYNTARRINKYGYQINYRSKITKSIELYDKLVKIKRVFRNPLFVFYK